MEKIAARILFLWLSSLLVGCVSNIPVKDYVLAKAAFDAARESEAMRYAPGLWHKAEIAYREGEALFADRSYGNAEEMFLQARILSEKAENEARLARFKAGDSAL